MKKILIWTASYPPVLGGLQTITRQLANGLAERGHNVLVLTNRYPYSLSAHEQQGLVRVERISHYPQITSRQFPIDIRQIIKSQLKFPNSQRQIVKIVKDFDPDIINIHFPHPQLPYWPMIKDFFKGRLIISLHGHDILRWFREQEDGTINTEFRSVRKGEIEKRELLTSFLGEALAITACSAWMLAITRQLCPTLPKSTKVIHNAVNLERFQRDVSFNENASYIFSFGRLAPHKGFDLLIKAYSKLKNKMPNLQLWIGGEGEERENLIKIAKTYGVFDKVKLCGLLLPKEVVTYSKKSQAIIIPSKREPFGISVLEGIASGRPVIATNVGGIPEASGGLATLVPPTVEGLAQGILSVLQKKQPTVSNLADIKDHLNQFTLERFINQYEETLIGND